MREPFRKPLRGRVCDMGHAGITQESPERPQTQQGLRTSHPGGRWRAVCDRGHTGATQETPERPQMRQGPRGSHPGGRWRAVRATGATQEPPSRPPRGRTCDRGHAGAPALRNRQVTGGQLPVTIQSQTQSQTSHKLSHKPSHKPTVSHFWPGHAFSKKQNQLNRGFFFSKETRTHA